MSRYDDYPDHPLHGVPDELLEAARTALPVEELVDPEMLEPIADAILLAILEAQ